MKYTEAQKQEIAEAMKIETNLLAHKRLQVIHSRMNNLTPMQTVEIVGVSRKTVFRYCALYKKGGIDELLPKPRGGLNRKLKEATELAILDKLAVQAKNGQYCRIAELKVEFEKLAGVEYGFSGFWRLLERSGWHKIVPRGQHPKKASDEAIIASKKLT
jgi:transposase